LSGITFIKGTFIRNAGLANWAGLITPVGASAMLPGAGAGIGLLITAVAVFTAVSAPFVLFIIGSPAY
jgi:hypothetical protein